MKGIKNYKRGQCCYNCEYFVDYVKAPDGCRFHNVKIAGPSMCDDFKYDNENIDERLHELRKGTD